MTRTLKAVSVFIVLALGFAAQAAAGSLEEAVLLEANSIRVADGAAQLFRRLPVVKHCCDANETIFISREDIPKPSCGLIPPDRPDFSSPAL
jgi:hypothetical protein